MPIWLRNFTFQEIKEFYLNQNKQAEALRSNKTKEIARPDIDPTYKSKASKK